MPIGVISETCVYFLEYLEESYAFFLSIVPYILNEGSLFFCKYVFMFILYPLYTVYNKTCEFEMRKGPMSALLVAIITKRELDSKPW